MKKQGQKKDPDRSNFIPGIFNYCDRWCERCSFCSRCMNCTLAEEEFGDLRESDLSNDAFWQKMTEVLESTYAMLKEIANAEGIDLDAIDYDDTIADGESELIDHLIIHLSNNYLGDVAKWFETRQHLFLQKEMALNQIHVLESSENPENDAIRINDAIEVIRWYQFQIHVKLKRAIDSAADEECFDDDDRAKDSDGSAKVALIGIDRSLSAWKILLSHFPDDKEAIVSFIKVLEGLINRTESQFPDARDFVRPGFDEAHDIIY